MSAKKNPLYVVTDNGNVVEEASGMIDAIVKKLGLEPALEIFNSLLSLLNDQVGNYGFFLYIQELVDSLVAMLEDIAQKVSLFIPGSWTK